MDFLQEPNRIACYSPENQLLAEVTFPDLDSGTVNINHTFVDDSLRGEGIASKLLYAAVEVLEKQNKKAVVTCSYAQAWFKNHAEYQALLVK